MRTGAGFSYSINASPSPSAVPPHNAWHSPVPYLFGGLAAMLGLIAFALLILACSYWRLSNYLEEAGESNSGDATKQDEGEAKPPPCFVEGFVVIMAGDHKPTFLATPISSRASSFGDDNSNNRGGGKDTTRATEEDGGKADGQGDGTATVSQPAGDRNPEP